MNINPTYETIGSIFQKNILFEVPKYQRYYSWDDEQIDDFIKDIDKIYQCSDISDAQEHFFGGIVCVHHTVPGSTRNQNELIDGQQRITTVMLLVINIIRQYEAMRTDENAADVDQYLKILKERYLYYFDKINRRPIVVNKLVLSNADKQALIDIMEGRPVTETRDSHAKLKNAFERLHKYVTNLLRGADYNKSLDILDKLENILQEKCTVILIEADSRDAAYKLFQALNDRGTGLTEGDLLKSKTLEVLEKNYAVKQAALQMYWDEILQETPKKVEDFLRTYYASVCGMRVGRTSLYDDFLRKFFPNIVSVEEIANEESADALVNRVKSILDEIRHYRKIVSGEWPFEIEQPVTEWQRKRLNILVNFLNFDITLPLLLSAINLGQKKYAELVFMLEKFMFRHKSVCNLGHQKLSILFMEEANKIRIDPDNYRLTTLRNKLKEYIATECTDEVFSISISKLRYKSGGNKILRYFFSMLAEHYTWYVEGATGNPKPNTAKIIDMDNVTIEHICSQNTTELAPAFTGDDVNRIANLTILTLDENGNRVKNKIYVQKKPVYVKSDYEINKFFTTIDEWTIEAADKWLQNITEMACKVFMV